jgi:alpha-tubulin suppressor-like RCC1 family protein
MSVWAWGRNDFGQLGIGSRIHSQRPLQVLGLSDIQAIAAGGDSSYALKKDGTVWAWGNNQNGQLGNRTTTSRTYPVLMEGLQKVTLIDAGDAFFFAAREDGEVCTWSFRSITLSCQASNAKMIAAGGSTAIILDQSGEVRQEGTAICDSSLNRPVLQYVTDVQVGSNYLLMKRDNGSLWVCGEGLPTTRPILDSSSALSPVDTIGRCCGNIAV